MAGSGGLHWHMKWNEMEIAAAMHFYAWHRVSDGTLSGMASA